MARTVPLRDIAYARSGDKGDVINIGVMAKDSESYEFLKKHLTAEVVRKHFEGIVTGDVTRYDMDNLESLEFVMNGALGGGATQTLMMDQTGKAHGANLLRLVLTVED
jgi:hypothetical protein